MQGYQAAELLLSIGVGGITFTSANKIEFKVTHSDDDSTFENVDSTDILGVSTISSGIVKALTAAHSSAASYRFGYVGDKRYVRVQADFSGTHGTGTPISVVVAKSYGHNNPQADQA